jgi:hypothetical protein
MKDGLLCPLILAFNLITRGRPSSPNYFSYEDKLPPIPKLDSSSIYGDSISVLYTNDPDCVSQWIEDHDIMSGLTVIGWDVEVSESIEDQSVLLSSHPCNGKLLSRVGL